MSDHDDRKQKVTPPPEGGDNKRRRSIEDDQKTKNKGRRRSKMIFDWGAAEDADPTAQKKEVHPGSYANPQQRERFDIQLELDDTTLENENEAETKEEVEASEKRCKRKFALFLGYIGSGYSGFQMNEEQKTIQAELELALLRSRLLLPSNFGFTWKYGWSTSGRTDKGVHACGQVGSCKLEVFLDKMSKDDIRDAINEQLPSTIQVLDVIRTTRNFCAKTQRHRVRYQYLIPSFMLQDADSVFQKVVDSKDDSTISNTTLSPEDINNLQTTQLMNYRVTEEQLEKLRAVLREYQGTHRFHQFTRKISATDDRANRYIESFEVAAAPILIGSLEWIPTTIVGQSFLLNQIRKMIGLALAVVQGAASVKDLKQALSSQSDKEKEECVAVRVPTAPAQGLFLDMSFYDGYNKRKSSMNSNQEFDDILWDDESSPAYARYKAFQSRVMQHIGTEEILEANFLQYLFQEYKAKRRVLRKSDEPDDSSSSS